MVAKEKEKESPFVFPPPYKIKIPFSQRFVKVVVEAQIMKFVEMLKEIYINVPFIEVLFQITTYVKFLKVIMSKNIRLEEHESVAMTATSSVGIQNMSPKLKDLWSFSISCQLYTMEFERALCDLGASIILMLVSLCKRLIIDG